MWEKTKPVEVLLVTPNVAAVSEAALLLQRQQRVPVRCRPVEPDSAQSEITRGGIDLVFIAETVSQAWVKGLLAHRGEEGGNLPIIVVTPSDGSDGCQTDILAAGACEVLASDELNAATVGIALRHAIRAKQLFRQVEKAQYLDAFGTLVREVSHDLSNLLTGILGFSELVAMRVGDTRVRRSLARVEGAAREAEELILKLLDAAPLLEGELELFDLRDVAKSARTLHHHLGAEEGLIFGLTLPDRPLPVRGFPATLQRALLDLFLFSDALTQGGEQILVELSRETLKSHHGLMPGCYGRLHIEIPGIDATCLAIRLVEMLTASGGRVLQHAGGVALALAAKIARKHHGQLSPVWAPEGGFALELLLPLDESAAATPVHDESSRESPRNAVLLVDTDALMLDTAARLLGYLGCEAFLARDIPSAAKFCERWREQILLIIVDPALKGPHGESFLASLAAMAPQKKILLASQVNPSRYLGQEQSPMVLGWLPKPFRLKQLQEWVERVSGQEVGRA